MEILKVLIVDDEPGIRSGISRILTKFIVDYPFMDDNIGFSTLEASTGEEAINIIEKDRPHIVLLDNKLPGIHGVDVLEYINKNFPDILVVMITSYASLDLAVKATNFGAYDFVPKPFTPQELKSSMENITKHYFLRRMTQKLNKEGRQIRFRFLSVLSHELKAPLNAIEGYLKMIKEHEFGNNIENYDEIIERSLSRISSMRNMIMDMLDLTQIESGKKVREISNINITQIARTAIDTMNPYAIQKDVTIFLNAPDDIYIQADQEEMEIILNNLISNAIKYNISNGKVFCNITKNENEIVTDYNLEQNYPNPFNPTTKISFAIPNNEKVTIEIFNSNGEKIKTSLDENKVAGKYQLEFNAEGLSSGIYFYRITANKFSQTKKMILIK